MVSNNLNENDISKKKNFILFSDPYMEVINKKCYESTKIPQRSSMEVINKKCYKSTKIPQRSFLLMTSIDDLCGIFVLL
jgi:hypothetical protein